MTTGAARQAESEAGHQRSNVARAGLVGKGLLYTAVGLLAVDVASGSGGGESASKEGAIERVAQAPFGKFLMIVLAVTLVALVIWKALQAIAGDPVEGSEASDRAKFAVKAVLYGGAAATAVSVLIANWSSGSSSGSGSSDGGSSQEQAAAVVMDWPAGRYLVMVAGLVAIGYGVYQIYKHTINTEFMQRLTHPGGSTEAALENFGRAGYVARGGVVIGIGVFFVIAGINQDSDDAGGLSQLLQTLADKSWGQILLWIVALGLVAYGLFSLAEARFRRTV